MDTEERAKKAKERVRKDRTAKPPDLGAALSSGHKGDFVIPWNCDLRSITLFSDQSGGSVFFGIWRDALANFPPTSGDTIAPSGVPLISGAIRSIYSGSTALAGWTTSFTAGDVFSVVIHSGATMTRASIAMSLGVK